MEKEKEEEKEETEEEEEKEEKEEKKKVADGKPSFVYLLAANHGNSTYVGATIDLQQRLRKHNQEIKGGAIATKKDTWTRLCHVSGFPSWTAALQFEWRWKQITRKQPKHMNSIQRRILALKQLMNMERPTTKAVAYSDWTLPCTAHMETEIAQKYYDALV